MEDVFRYHAELLLPENDSYDMFLSYRHASDKELTRRMAFALKRDSDLAVFRDEDCLPVGRRFDFEFLKALGHTEIYVPMMSVGAVSRMLKEDAHEHMDNWLAELVMALSLVQKGKLKLIVPVFCCTLVDIADGNRQAIESFRANDLLSRLNDALNSKVLKNLLYSVLVQSNCIAGIPNAPRLLLDARLHY
jgi:hypothetical protein